MLKIQVSKTQIKYKFKNFNTISDIQKNIRKSKIKHEFLKREFEQGKEHSFLNLVSYEIKKEENCRQSASKRAMKRAVEIIECNDYTHFITLTFKGNKTNREREKAIINWLKNYRKNYGKIKYILIPEYHKNGLIHYHGLIKAENMILEQPNDKFKFLNIYKFTNYKLGYR